MKRFGSIYPFLEHGWGPRHVGRLVANYEFVKALLLYGSYDEYVFSNSSRLNLRTFADVTHGWGLSGTQLARVRHVSYADLPGVLRTESFHVFHLGGWGWFMPGLHDIRARYARNPWPITAVTHALHGPDPIDYAVRLSHAGLAPYDAIFCTSADGRTALHRILERGALIAGRSYRGRLEQMPLGIDDGRVDGPTDPAAGAQCRARLGIPSDTTVLLVLGRLTPFQKMDLAPLLRVFARRIVPASARPVKLLLAGGATADELLLVKHAVDREGLQAHVIVRAEFPDGEKDGLLAAADLLVSPVDNTQETFGLSLLEAMAAGLPVVASRFDGYKDLVRDGVDGFLVDTYGGAWAMADEWFDVTDLNVAQLQQSQSVAVDLDQLADRILRLVADPDLRRTMGAAGRARVDAEFRWSRIIARYEAMWDRLAVQAQTTGLPPAGDHAYNFGPGRAFSHYPSQQLGAKQRLVAGDDPAGVRPYEEVADLVEPPLLAALHACAAGGGAEGVTVAQLQATSAAPPAQTQFAILWMLKYGLLRVVG
ncbi:MAG: glycosyltransferase family 4 protein [Acidobacteriota bacterium]|nr:glycosyltransferase family 4 protein [Acidobacteriota bacterium]